MPSLLELVLHPDRRKPAPEPVPVSLAPAFVVGSAAWVVALTVLLLWPGVEVGPTVVATCCVGVLLGGLGLLWARRQD
ncbi:DUF2530 domain-containing protein [Cellulomonas sp. NPDC055163]